MTLLQHQTQALTRLNETGGKQLLNLCPGAGKTLIALTFARTFKRVLILCPASIVGVWKDENLKWFNEPVTIIRGTPTQRKKQYALYQDGLMVMGYETYRSDHARICLFEWDLLVMDECHRAKSPTAKLTKSIRKNLHRFPRRVLLSGTPLKNSWADMWSQVSIVSPGCLYDTFFQFRATHAICPVPTIPQMITGWRNTDLLLEKIKPHVFTVDKEVIQSALPPVTMQDIAVELTPQEKRAYTQIRDELRLELDSGELTVGNALVKIGRLRQCVNGLHSFGMVDVPCSKLSALRELLETLQGEKVIIFSMYAETVCYLAGQLDCKHVITGASSKRDETIRDWKERGTVLLGTSALYEGINAQEAHYVVQFEPCWTKADESQRIGRAWRTGQKNPVTVYNLLATGTVDEYVRKMIERKGEMMEQMASYTQGEIAELLC